MCKCFLGRRGAYWPSSSFGGAFVTKAYITLACAWQRDLSLVSALLSALINSHTNSQQHSKQDIPSHPHPAFLHLSAFPERSSYLIHIFKNCHSWHKHRKGLISALLFPDCLVSIPKYVIQIEPGCFQSKRSGYYTGFVSFSLTHSRCLYPPTLLLCLCLPPPTSHLLSFTSASAHPVSLCAGAWTVSPACNTNYCALLRSREQRGEIRAVCERAS